MTQPYEPQEDFNAAWRQALADNLASGHLLSTKLDVSIELTNRLYWYARADSIITVIAELAGRREAPPAACDRMHQLACILTNEFQLNAVGNLTRLLKVDDWQVTHGIHAATRQLIEIEVIKRYWTIDADEQRDLAGDIYAHNCVSRSRVFEQWDPLRGGFQRYLGMCVVRPGAVPMSILRQHGVEHLRRKDRKVEVEGIDEHSESRLLQVQDAGFDEVDVNDVLDRIREAIRRETGQDIDPAMLLHEQGYTSDETARILGMGTGREVRDRRRNYLRKLKKIIDRFKDEAS